MTNQPAWNKGRKMPPEVLTCDEVRSLIRASSPKCPSGVRNAALIAVLFRGALRCSEALGLSVSDVDATAGTLKIRHGKGDRHRVIGLHDDALDKLRLWLAERTKLGINGHSPLFCTLKAGPMSGRYVRSLLPRLAKRAGIERARVHPHMLRHTGAYRMACEGVSIPAIQRHLGHERMTTTVRYLDHLNPQEAIDAARGMETVL